MPVRLFALPALSVVFASLTMTTLSPLAIAQTTPSLYPEPKPSLVVGGRGEVSAKPDRAVVTLGSSASADTAGAAQSLVNDALKRITDALKSAGIADDKVQTQGLYLQPVYDAHTPSREGQPPKIIGYRAQSTLRIEVDAIDTAGRVVDAGLKAGANEMQGITFEIKDDSNMRREALAKAVADAQAKGAIMADAAGVRLAPIPIEISEGGFTNFALPSMMARGGMMAMDASSSSTSVSPGSIRVEASVTVKYWIQPKN